MRWQCGWAAGCSALVIAAAGCGGTAQRATPKAPRIAPKVAAPLAAHADAVAAALGDGDACVARGEAYALRRGAERARMAAPLRVRLLKAVRRLAAQLPACAPPPAPAPPPPAAAQGRSKTKEHGHGHGRGHGKKHGGSKKKGHKG